jgi:histidinol phosphatase-like PHP family hydrolase
MIPRELSNSEIAELLAREAEASQGILQRAFKKAARSAFLWPEQASSLRRNGIPLTNLKGIGPFIAERVQRWLDNPPVKKVIPPVLRRDFITLADARAQLQRKQMWSQSLRGDLQMHTHWSDGSGSLAEMAAAAAARNYEYIAITDHSKGLKIAGGIDEARLAAQGREIDVLNQQRTYGKVTLLRSTEMNLNPRGEGDMKPSALSRLDLVLGSFHSSLRTTADQTERYLAALRNPNIQILGHPRGRIYNYRLGLRADWHRVLAEAAKLDKAVEIDCYPDRQDLNLALLRIARGEGVRISLGTDAHHPPQLEFIEFGLAAALLAKIAPERIINFLPLDQLKTWVKHVRGRARAR